MKTVNLTLGVLGALIVCSSGLAADIIGAAFRLSSDKAQILSVKVAHWNPFEPNKVPTEVRNIDYEIRFGPSVIWLREGDAEIVDPDAMDVPVEKIIDKSYDGFQFTGIVCGSRGKMVCGIMIRKNEPEEAPTVVPTSIYFSIHSPNKVDIADAIRGVVAKTEVRMGGKNAGFRRIDDTAIKDGLERLIKVLEGSVIQ